MSQHPDRLQQAETLPRVIGPTSFDTALAQARPLYELGRRILEPQERPDNGEIRYTTTPEAVAAWRSDPYGLRKFEFIADAYGIPRERLGEVLQEVGLGDYLRAKSEGRLVGQVSTQILNPTYYFMANALILGYLTRHYSIPTALMVSTYETDIFSYDNHDKTGALGEIDFLVGVDPNSGNMQTVKIKLTPIGVRQRDGSVRSVDSNGLSGQRCCDIIVRVGAASDSKNKSYPREGNSNQVTAEDAQFHTLAALGINIEQEAISLTDFYKQMWIATINRLREAGELPSEEEMPMFFVSGEQVYSALPKLANPPNLTHDILGGVDSNDSNLKQLTNGIVIKTDTGVMDPAWYYPLEYGLPDLYFECSSCGGDNFVDKLSRADRLLEVYGLTTSEVRLPDIEIPELERFVIHPSGGHIDMMSARGRIERATALIVEEIQILKEDIAKERIDKSIGRHRLKKLLEMLNTERVAAQRSLIRSIIDDHLVVELLYKTRHNFIIPEVIAATYRELIGQEL